MARLSFRCDQELVDLVDRARGDVAREKWLRRVVEREVARADSNRRAVVAVEQVSEDPGSDDVRAPEVASPTPAPAEQPYDPYEAEAARRAAYAAAGRPKKK